MKNVNTVCVLTKKWDEPVFRGLKCQLGRTDNSTYTEGWMGGDLASTLVTKPKVHAERVVTLVKQSL